MKNILIGVAILVVLLVAGFFALNHYIYQEKQDDAAVATTSPEVTVKESRRAVSPSPAPKDGLTVSEVNRGYVLFSVTVNSSGSCERSEYKMDYGDGENDWFEVKAGECKPRTVLYSHTYRMSNEPETTFTARVHDLTNIQYHEPAFDTVQNPIYSVNVDISRTQ